MTAPVPSAHQMLRAGTADVHERLDARLGGFDLADPDGYRRFLLVHARALPAIEAALDAAGFADALDDWPMRRRALVLEQDLATLGLAPPTPLPFAPVDGIAAAWGAAYVVEGSRLGGALLARRVGADMPKSYLAPALPPGAWRKFLAKLDESLYLSSMHPPALDAARRTFDLFARSANAA